MTLFPLIAASCGTGSGGATQGLLQPQSITGPCDVKKFFILPFTRSYTDMTLNAAGQTCQFTMFNPNLQLIQNAVLLTEQPGHGRADVALVNGNRMVAVSYTPAPGYIGPDRFTATIEPGDKTFTVNVAGPQPGR